MASPELRSEIVRLIGLVGASLKAIQNLIVHEEIAPAAKIAEISDGALLLVKKLADLSKAESNKRSNFLKGLCEYLSAQHGICMVACGECPTPDRKDCGGRWADGHNAHLGACKHVVQQARRDYKEEVIPDGGSMAHRV